MRMDKLWVVRDPNRYSATENMVFEMEARILGNYIAGSPHGAWTNEHHTIYSNREDAVADAAARLAAVKKAPTHSYEPGSWDARAADSLAAAEPPRDGFSTVQRRLAAVVNVKLDRALDEARNLEQTIHRLVLTLTEQRGDGGAAWAVFAGRVSEVAGALGELAGAKEAFAVATEPSAR